ncbi:exodeoxyribonuclease VII large subunit [Tepidimonas charontis]|uniref:Exodeoxyribonuclease 7 large subunit n=1 Tax=Tepidimonas charontis TaxID=2267262 RepID=A0A554XHP3_9BURK|nr:exodeoxyribonuclease VII large subunit [Tepidimonas charontis]TSE35356.1 Exodeoxyribonuclease 7 large subunit [Tepidimonas charontis]
MIDDRIEEDIPAWRVGALVNAVADALRVRFNPVRVRGEVSASVRAASGHQYFILKDADGQLRCAWFRRAAQTQEAAVALRDGLQVEVLGRVDVYTARGDLQLIVERVLPLGQGSLYEEFLRRKARLQAEGWFDAARKRALPRYPSSIGVVTSLDAAALRDVATTLERRVPHLLVWVYPSAVQGAEAPAQLCAALQRAYADHRAHGRPAVLLLVRGGGSLEDLWAFNDPELVRTIAQAPLPVVCGVGHETDFTLADFAADLRAPTPTAAAELCAPDAVTLHAALAQAQQRLQSALQRRLDIQAQRLDGLAQRLGRPSALTAREQQRLLRLHHRLNQGTQQTLGRQAQRLQGLQHAWWAAAHSDGVRRLQQAQALQGRWVQAVQAATQRQRQRLEHWQTQLRLLDPGLVLQRGYAWVTTAHGEVVTSAAQVEVGQTLGIALAHGALDVDVRVTRPEPTPRD